MTKVDLRFLVQRYYFENGLMRSVAYNQDDTQPTNEVETVIVKLHDSTGVVEQSSGTLYTDGSLSVNFSSVGDYFLSIVGRNSLELFAPSAFTFNGVDVVHDFTTQSQNTLEVEIGIYAAYSGDVNQDGVIDELDQTQILAAIEEVASGVQVCDLNGDGVVDNSDTDVFWDNVGKTVVYPIGLPKPR